MARHGVGYDSVDVPAMTRAGIVVTNTPMPMPRPVATIALTFILALAGKFMLKDRLTRTGRWDERMDNMGMGLTGRTLGVIGAGRIGKELLRMARMLDMKLLAADPYVNEVELAYVGARKVPTPRRSCAQSDFVVTIPLLNDETRHLMGAAQFALMKPTAYFINVSRGPVVDEPALIAALQERRIAGAALDVFEQEPVDPGEPAAGDGRRHRHAAFAVLDRRVLPQHGGHGPCRASSMRCPAGCRNSWSTARCSRTRARRRGSRADARWRWRRCWPRR